MPKLRRAHCTVEGLNAEGVAHGVGHTTLYFDDTGKEWHFDLDRGVYRPTGWLVSNAIQWKPGHAVVLTINSVDEEEEEYA